MRPLVTCDFIVNNQANDTAVTNFITNRIAQLGAGFTLTSPVHTVNHPGRGRLINFSILCATEADAEQLFDDIVAAWTGGGVANRIQSGSRVKRTRNYDDEGNGQPDEVMETATKA
jgi:hypothetical protein